MYLIAPKQNKTKKIFPYQSLATLLVLGVRSVSAASPNHLSRQLFKSPFLPAPNYFSRFLFNQPTKKQIPLNPYSIFHLPLPLPSLPNKRHRNQMVTMASNPPPNRTTTTRTRESSSNSEPLDAGALFVLKSEGTWIHCGYHLTTSIVAPALLSLPLAVAQIGWAPGVMFLLVAGGVTFYSYTLLSLVLDHYALRGHRLLRFRDMAHHILGPGWGCYYIGPLQFSLCFTAVVAGTLLAGQSMKAIYLLEQPDGTMKLYEFVIISGAITVILAQFPSFHSLRHFNLISLILCLAYSACATAGSIYIGHSSRAPEKDYSIPGDEQDHLFNVFNAASIIATTYGNGIIPEIQATIAPPVKGKMFKGLCLCYIVVMSTFLSVAISGYWTFGNQARSNILFNFSTTEGHNLIPKWFIIMTNIFTIVQIFAVTIVYLQPTNEVLEGLFADPKRDQYSARNVIPRILFRSMVVAVGTTIAAMLPFFGDIIAVVGAFGFLPLDFVVPAVMYNITFRPSSKDFVFWINTMIATVSSILTVLGCIATVRQLTMDAKTYKLFANL